MSVKLVNFIDKLFKIFTISDEVSENDADYLLKAFSQQNSQIKLGIEKEVNKILYLMIAENHTNGGNLFPVEIDKVLILPNLLYSDLTYAAYQISYDTYPLVYNKKSNQIELLEILKVLDVWNSTENLVKIRTDDFWVPVISSKIKTKIPIAYTVYMLFESYHPVCAAVKQYLGSVLSDNLKYCLASFTYRVFFRSYEENIFKDLPRSDLDKFINLISNYYHNFENFVKWLYQKFDKKMDLVNQVIGKIDNPTAVKLFRIIKQKIFPTILSVSSSSSIDYMSEISNKRFYLFDNDSRYLFLYDRIFNPFIFEYLTKTVLPNFTSNRKSVIRTKLREYKNSLKDYFDEIVQKLSQAKMARMYQRFYTKSRLRIMISGLRSPLGGLNIIPKDLNNDSFFIIKPLLLKLYNVNSPLTIPEVYIYEKHNNPSNIEEGLITNTKLLLLSQYTMNLIFDVK